MNKQSLITIFAVSLLLLAASSAILVRSAESDAAASVENDFAPEFAFDGYSKITQGSVDTYLMQKTVNAGDLFGNAVPTDCGESVTVYAILTLDNETKTIGMDIEVISGTEPILSYSDTISENGMTEESAWVYDGLIPAAVTRGIVGDVQNAWNLIKELQDLLPKVTSKVIKEKIENMLAKAVVKKIALAAASAVIPGIGWAIAVVSAGLAVYDILQLLDELPELVESAKVDIAGCEFDEDTYTLKLAERYGGHNSNESIPMESTGNLTGKESGKYYVAYVDMTNQTLYLSNFEISVQHTIAIMSISVDKKSSLAGLSVYTPRMDDAKMVAENAAGSGTISIGNKSLHHDSMHQGAKTGMMHFHHVKHDDERYWSHSFYGNWL